MNIKVKTSHQPIYHPIMFYTRGLCMETLEDLLTLIKININILTALHRNSAEQFSNTRFGIC